MAEGRRQGNYALEALPTGVIPIAKETGYSGGSGPDQFLALAVTERWVKTGAAQAQIIASHLTENRLDLTSLLCRYL